VLLYISFNFDLRETCPYIPFSVKIVSYSLKCLLDQIKYFQFWKFFPVLVASKLEVKIFYCL
jgi:hypothetical protein